MKKVIFFLLGWAAFIQTGICQLALPSLKLKQLSILGSLSLPSLQLPDIGKRRTMARGNETNATNDLCTTSCAVILPLTALELQGYRINNSQVLLNWKTKNETASKGFDVERSLSDAAHFSLVGGVSSSISTAVEKKYALTDANSFSDISFYRIRQIDLNGNFAYSNTVQVKGYNGKEAVWLSPNPTSSVAVLSCFTASRAATTVKMITAHGQVVYQKAWTLGTGSNSLTIPASSFPPGIYYVQLIWPDGHHFDSKLAIQ